MIAATDVSEVNIGVYEDAEARAMLVNVVDVPPLCNFILPAVVRSGPLAVAISTAGASPALAKRMKREIGSISARSTHSSRSCSTTSGAGPGDPADLPGTQVFFESIVNGDPDPVGMLRAGDGGRSRPDRGSAAHGLAPAAR